MKKIFLTQAFFIIAQLSFAQWTSGSGNTTTSDNIGIGTSSPGTKLTVYQTQATGNPWSANSAFNVISQFGNDANGNIGVLAKNAGVANYSGMWLNNSFDIFSYNNYSGWFRVMNNDATKSVPSISLLPDLNGNVSIGNIAPQHNLEIAGSTGGRAQMGNGSIGQLYEIFPYEIASNQNAGWTGTMFGVRTGGLNSTSTPITQNVSANSPAYQQAWAMTFGTDKNQVHGSSYSIWTGDATTPGTAMSELFRIKSNGNVGIGTVNPTSKLDIAGWSGDNDIKFENYSPTTTGNENQSLVFTGSDNGGTSKGNYELLRMKVISANGGVALSKVQFIQNGGNTPTLAFDVNQKVGIGTSSPDEKLTVNGTIHSKEVKVDNSIPVPDYVFESKYKLISLDDVKTYIKKNHHLPEIPSAKEIEVNGISLGDMNMRLLKKVEELTLYLIKQNEQIAEQNKQISEQSSINKSLQKEISRLAKRR